MDPDIPMVGGDIPTAQAVLGAGVRWDRSVAGFPSRTPSCALLHVYSSPFSMSPLCSQGGCSMCRGETTRVNA